MDGQWLKVLGLVLIIEAMLPFISPKGYRQAMMQMAQTPDKALRAVALVALCVGAALVYFSR
ncbi:MAG: hypothetical protein B7Y07_00205 [Halothiobacillus sp. 24-54-40]|jgi:uncharacterized protein YjeT (DUF2065 family)|nr:DUF2065 domain-containing protein [Halothiobacillaceae bacterium]OYV43797.1 MAG: hypothetical protein B7X12_09960 [Halothiobacillus sp. 20-53-49]OYY44277.1 MAG: hypothetical protein B7Y58_00200 [Halothiobacillus sp. 35-54-62]OYZ88393.1 MAG: hypothetical protein B7Y07_00205 [Halothiobacillus sp. 24-54-40]OZA81701.1 MAG: hypothetical protein B7X64_00215 [Halothiobacillus sp. 39-53-45]HQS01806.1 DUF2065 domain-containing protein [Halothiobacillus sp.]